MDGSRQFLRRRILVSPRVAMPIACHLLDGRLYRGELWWAGIDDGVGPQIYAVFDHDVSVPRRWHRIAEPVAKHVTGLEPSEHLVRCEVHHLKVAWIESCGMLAGERGLELVALLDGSVPEDLGEADERELAGASVVQLNEPSRTATSMAVTSMQRRWRECSPPVSIASGDQPPRSMRGEFIQRCSSDCASACAATSSLSTMRSSTSKDGVFLCSSVGPTQNCGGVADAGAGSAFVQKRR